MVQATPNISLWLIFRTRQVRPLSIMPSFYNTTAWWICCWTAQEFVSLFITEKVSIIFNSLFWKEINGNYAKNDYITTQLDSLNQSKGTLNDVPTWKAYFSTDRNNFRDDCSWDILAVVRKLSLCDSGSTGSSCSSRSLVVGNWSDLSGQRGKTRPNLTYKMIVVLLPKLIAFTSIVS